MFAPGLYVFFPVFFSVICLVIFVSHIMSIMLPVDIYFSFRSFLFDVDNRLRYPALVLKLAVPLLSGLVVTLAFAWWGSIDRNDDRTDRRLTFYQFVRDNFGPTLFLSGAFAAAVQAWPTIIYWDFLADPRVVNLRLLFYAVYLIYFVSYGYFALAGGYLALTSLHNASNVTIPGAESLKALTKSARNGVLGFVTSGLGSLILEGVKSYTTTTTPG